MKKINFLNYFYWTKKVLETPFVTVPADKPMVNGIFTISSSLQLSTK